VAQSRKQTDTAGINSPTGLAIFQYGWDVAGKLAMAGTAARLKYPLREHAGAGIPYSIAPGV